MNGHLFAPHDYQTLCEAAKLLQGGPTPEQCQDIGNLMTMVLARAQTLTLTRNDLPIIIAPEFD